MRISTGGPARRHPPNPKTTLLPKEIAMMNRIMTNGVLVGDVKMDGVLVGDVKMDGVSIAD